MGEKNEIVETITIPLEEYRRLLETHTRVEVLKVFVSRDEKFIDKEDCVAIFGI